MDPLSPRNPRVQAVRRLARQARERAVRRAFVVEGPTLIAEALDAGLGIEQILFTADAPAKLVDRARATGAEGLVVSERAMASMATTVTPQPVIAVVHRRDVGRLADVAGDRPGHVLVLDRIQDPGNAGTILRSAEASGAAAAVFVAGSVDLHNPKVVRASAGSIFRVAAFQDPDLTPGENLTVLGAAGRSVFATAADGELDYDCADLTDAVILLGNEAGGVDFADLPRLDGILRIPQVGRAESLNVAMAATVLCFEAARQRRAKSS